MTEQREALIAQLAAFGPMNEQEERDKDVILHLLRTDADVFLRSDLTAHMTASAWTVSPDRKQVLMAWHNIYRSWAWLGGHADGSEDLAAVALREVCEESGIRNVRLAQTGIFSVETLTVDGHEKRGVYVPSHLHLNVTYLLEADPKEATRVKPDENSGVAWFGAEEALGKVREEWMRTHIYQKLSDKLSAMTKG